MEKAVMLYVNVVTSLLFCFYVTGSDRTAWFANEQLPCEYCDTKLPSSTSPRARHGIQKYMIELSSENICQLDYRFLSFTIDAIELKRHFRCFDMNSLKVNVLARGLSPAYIRLGGSPQDFLTFYEHDDGESGDWQHREECAPHFQGWRTLKPFLMPSYYINKIAKFADKNQLDLIVGLNLLQRTPDGSWDPENSLKVINYMSKSKYACDWSLGNEPNRFMKYGEDCEVSPAQLKKDFVKLRHLTKSKIYGPDLAHPTYKSLQMMKSFLMRKPPINAVTYHEYTMHESVSTVERFLEPAFIDKTLEQMKWVRTIMTRTNHTSDLWLSESGSASGGGAENLSDTFIAGFHYLSKLGLASKICHQVVIRQSFYGGHYGMLDAVSLDPLPDYWLTYIFKKLVGRTFISEQRFNNGYLRTFTYCAKNNPSNLVIMAINYDTHNMAGMSLARYSKRLIKQYVFTAPKNYLQSKVVLLNGSPLQLTTNGALPFIDGDFAEQPFFLPRTSLGFFVVVDANRIECEGSR